jgi:hypothetical protein
MLPTAAPGLAGLTPATSAPRLAGLTPMPHLHWGRLGSSLQHFRRDLLREPGLCRPSRRLPPTARTSPTRRRRGPSPPPHRPRTGAPGPTRLRRSAGPEERQAARAGGARSTRTWRCRCAARPCASVLPSACTAPRRVQCCDQSGRQRIDVCHDNVQQAPCRENRAASKTANDPPAGGGAAENSRDRQNNKTTKQRAARKVRGWPLPQVRARAADARGQVRSGARACLLACVCLFARACVGRCAHSRVHRQTPQKRRVAARPPQVDAAAFCSNPNLLCHPDLVFR